MTLEQATNLKEDIEVTLTDRDYNDDLYISIRGVGTQTFKACAYHFAEEWLFIWTKKETFMLNKADLGDFVAIPLSDSQTIYN